MWMFKNPTGAPVVSIFCIPYRINISEKEKKELKLKTNHGFTNLSQIQTYQYLKADYIKVTQINLKTQMLQVCFSCYRMQGTIKQVLSVDAIKLPINNGWLVHLPLKWDFNLVNWLPHYGQISVFLKARATLTSWGIVDTKLIDIIFSAFACA